MPPRPTDQQDIEAGQVLARRYVVLRRCGERPGSFWAYDTEALCRVQLRISAAGELEVSRIEAAPWSHGDQAGQRAVGGAALTGPIDATPTALDPRPSASAPRSGPRSAGASSRGSSLPDSPTDRKSLERVDTLVTGGAPSEREDDPLTEINTDVGGGPQPLAAAPTDA